MKIEISSENPLQHATPALVIGCFEDAGAICLSGDVANCP